MLATRVWALWKGSYIILTIYFLVLSGNAGNFIFNYGLSLIRGTVLLAQPPFTGCGVIPLSNVMWIPFTNTLGFETLSICLIVYKSWPLAKLRGVKTPLFSLLLEDGVAHYLCFLASKLFVVGCIFVPTVLSPIVLPASLPIPVAALTINRLLLRLQRIMLNDRQGLTDYTTTRSSTVRYGTGDSDEDGSRGIITVGGTNQAGRRMYARRPSDLENELFSLGGGDIEMSLSRKDGERHTAAAVRRRSVALPTSTTVGSLSNMDVSVLDSKPGHAVE
jgi:hypothetical protein